MKRKLAYGGTVQGECKVEKNSSLLRPFPTARNGSNHNFRGVTPLIGRQISTSVVNRNAENPFVSKRDGASTASAQKRLTELQQPQTRERSSLASMNLSPSSSSCSSSSSSLFSLAPSELSSAQKIVNGEKICASKRGTDGARKCDTAERRGEIVGVQFGLWNPSDIRRFSVAKITKPRFFEHGRPVEEGLFDLRMGPAMRAMTCLTCEASSGRWRECPGHFGRIELACPVFHPNFIEHVVKVLNCICLDCSALLIPKTKEFVARQMRCRRAKDRLRCATDLVKSKSTNKQCCGTPEADRQTLRLQELRSGSLMSSDVERRWIDAATATTGSSASSFSSSTSVSASSGAVVAPRQKSLPKENYSASDSNFGANTGEDSENRKRKTPAVEEVAQKKTFSADKEASGGELQSESFRTAADRTVRQGGEGAKRAHAGVSDLFPASSARPPVEAPVLQSLECGCGHYQPKVSLEGMKVVLKYPELPKTVANKLKQGSEGDKDAPLKNPPSSSGSRRPEEKNAKETPEYGGETSGSKKAQRNQGEKRKIGSKKRNAEPAGADENPDAWVIENSSTLERKNGPGCASGLEDADGEEGENLNQEESATPEAESEAAAAAAAAEAAASASAAAADAAPTTEPSAASERRSTTMADRARVERAGSVRQMMADEALRILSRMSDEDCWLLGFDPATSHPAWMILTVLPVPPPCIRPIIVTPSSKKAMSQDHLTLGLAEIIKKNNQLEHHLQHGIDAFTNSLKTILEFQVATYIDNDHKGLPKATLFDTDRIRSSLSHRLKGKSSRLRGNLMGKRVNFTARSVITPDALIGVNEVGVPESTCKTLTFPERVNDYNFNRLLTAVQLGPSALTGANLVERADGSMIDLEKCANVHLEVGDIVHRHLCNGDVVALNRQPSLHRESVMAHRVRVLPGSSFRLNLTPTTPYNADFDGDEMNIHAPQSETARAELSELCDVGRCLVSGQANNPIQGLVQDTLLGARLLSRRDVLLTRADLMQLLLWSPVSFEKLGGRLPQPCLLKPEPRWSGKQVISVLFPESLSVGPSDNTFRPAAEVEEDGAKKRSSLGCVPQFSPSDTNVFVQNGVLLSGTLDKKFLGTRHGSLPHVLFNDCGPDRTRLFVEELQGIVRAYLMDVSGFSVGIGDCLADESAKAGVAGVMQRTDAAVDGLVSARERGALNRVPGTSLEETFEAQINQILNRARDEAGRLVSDSFERGGWQNSLKMMVTAGSKGGDVNIAQIAGIVGQQNVTGRRMPLLRRGRAMPHARCGDLRDTETRGMVKHSYIDGLTPTEFFTHAMGGREGLIDTAVKTASIGYIHRKIAKGSEDVVVAHDGTVRNAAGRIMQFAYGEDGMDGACFEWQNVSLVRLSDAEILERYGPKIYANSELGSSGGGNGAGVCDGGNCARLCAGDAHTEELLRTEKERILALRNCVRAAIYPSAESRWPLPANVLRVIEGVKGVQPAWNGGYALQSEVKRAKMPQKSKTTTTTKTTTTKKRTENGVRALERSLAFATDAAVATEMADHEKTSRLSSTLEYRANSDFGHFVRETTAMLDKWQSDLERTVDPSGRFGAASRGTLLMFVALVRGELSPRVAREKHGLVRAAQVESALRALLRKYVRGRAAAGEAVGICSAQAVGEPAMQMTLNSFHHAGIESRNVTQGVPRLEELLNATESMRTPSMQLHVPYDCDAPDSATQRFGAHLHRRAQRLAENLGAVLLRDFVHRAGRPTGGNCPAAGGANGPNGTSAAERLLELDSYTIVDTDPAPDDADFEEVCRWRAHQPPSAREARESHFGPPLARSLRISLSRESMQAHRIDASTLGMILSEHFDGEVEVIWSTSNHHMNGDGDNRLAKPRACFGGAVSAAGCIGEDLTRACEQNSQEEFSSGLENEHRLAGAAAEHPIVHDFSANEGGFIRLCLHERAMMDIVQNAMPEEHWRRFEESHETCSKTGGSEISRAAPAEAAANAEANATEESVATAANKGDQNVPTQQTANGCTGANRLTAFGESGNAEHTNARTPAMHKSRTFVTTTPRQQRDNFGQFTLPANNGDEHLEDGVEETAAEAKCKSSLISPNVGIKRHVRGELPVYSRRARAEVAAEAAAVDERAATDNLNGPSVCENTRRSGVDEEKEADGRQCAATNKDEVLDEDVARAWDRFTVDRCIDMVYDLVRRDIEKIVVDGIRRVKDVLVRKQVRPHYRRQTGVSESIEESVLETSGSNLLAAFTYGTFDHTRTYSNDPVEVAAVFGIEAGRACLLRELRRVMDFGGSYVNVRHLMLLCDVMTQAGVLMPMNRHGLNRRATSTIMRASLEDSVRMLIDAGCYAEFDPMQGPSERVVIGRHPAHGTGTHIDVLVDERRISAARSNAGTQRTEPPQVHGKNDRNAAPAPTRLDYSVNAFSSPEAEFRRHQRVDIASARASERGGKSTAGRTVASDAVEKAPVHSLLPAKVGKNPFSTAEAETDAATGSATAASRTACEFDADFSATDQNGAFICLDYERASDGNNRDVSIKSSGVKTNHTETDLHGHRREEKRKENDDNKNNNNNNNNSNSNEQLPEKRKSSSTRSEENLKEPAGRLFNPFSADNSVLCVAKMGQMQSDRLAESAERRREKMQGFSEFSQSGRAFGAKENASGAETRETSCVGRFVNPFSAGARSEPNHGDRLKRRRTAEELHGDSHLKSSSAICPYYIPSSPRRLQRTAT